MKVTILAIGSRGDVQPLMALAVGLRDAGYEVRVATHLHNQEFVTMYGFEYTPVRMDFRQFLQGEGAQAFLTPGGSPLRALTGGMRLLRSFAPLANDLFDDCWNACRDSQVIFSAALLPGCHIAEHLGSACFQVAFYPFSGTSEFPIPLLPISRDLPPFLNRMTYSITQKGAWLVLRKIVNNWRRQLGLELIRNETLFSYLERRQVPYLYGFSPTLEPKPHDWPAWCHVTGSWNLEIASEWQPPDDLVKFIEDDKPPLYIGFGSMADGREVQRTKAIVEALDMTTQRAVLLSGWSSVERKYLSDNIFVVESVPHEWLFPRVSAIIHHGGAGTTVAAAKSGVPSMVVPFLGDQFFWGRRVAEAGIGPAPIKMKQLTPKRLAKAIERMLFDTTLRIQAKSVGQKIQAENGVLNAIQVVNTCLSTANKG